MPSLADPSDPNASQIDLPEVVVTPPTTPPTTAPNALVPALAPIVQRESGGRPNIGWGNTDLSGVPLSSTGFPLWPGKPGPAGNSTAAGLAQITRSTWDPIARKLGITDFSPASQIAVANELYAERGLQPWQVSAKPSGASSGPDFASTILGTAATTNSLVPRQAEVSALPDSAASSPSASPVAMMALLSAGTHKFIPVQYDPFALQAPRIPLGDGGVGAAPSISETTRLAPAYVARTGMRQAYTAATKKGAGVVGPAATDPEISNLFAGVT